MIIDMLFGINILEFEVIQVLLNCNLICLSWRVERDMLYGIDGVESIEPFKVHSKFALMY